MAVNLVLSGTNGITLFSNKTGQAVSDRIMWTSIESTRDSAWKEIGYTGWDGLDAMFMGRKPERNIIGGHVNADNVADWLVLKAKVLGLGKAKVGYAATGPIVTATNQFIIVGAIRFQPMGEKAGMVKFTIDTVLVGNKV